MVEQLKERSQFVSKLGAVELAMLVLSILWNWNKPAEYEGSNAAGISLYYFYFLLLGWVSYLNWQIGQKKEGFGWLDRIISYIGLFLTVFPLLVLALVLG